MKWTLPTIALMMGMVDATHSEIKDIHWKIGPNIPEFRKGGCATALGGKIISVFGMRQPWGEMETMYIYDPAQDWWFRGPNAPVGQTYVQGTMCEGAFFAIGGRMRGVQPHCYRLEDKGNGEYLWTQMPDLNESRGWAPSVAIESKIYVCGGSKGNHGPTMNSVEMLDTAEPNPQWKIVTSIPGKSRGWLGAAAVKGKIYIIGGSHFFDPKPEQGDRRTRLAEVLVYDPQTGEWDTKRQLPYPLAGMDCCVYKDRYIIVAGGAGLVASYNDEMMKAYTKVREHKSYYTPFILVYDTELDQWRRLPSLLPVPTNDIRIVLLGNKLYALGGENIEPATSNTTPWFRIGEIVE
jgi:N-acetylneuraminic acid mutarotase